MQYFSIEGELLDFHRNRIGYFLAELAHYFFANNLRCQKALAAIGNLIFREEALRHGQEFQDLLLQFFNIMAAQGGYGQNSLELAFAGQFLEVG